MLRKQISPRWFTLTVAALLLNAATAFAEPFWTETAKGSGMRGKAETLPDFVDLAARLSPTVVNIATEPKSLPKVQLAPDEESGDGSPDSPAPPFENDDPAHTRVLRSRFTL